MELPRKFYFNIETKQIDININSDTEGYLGFQVRKDDNYLFLTLKNDLSGYDYNDIAEQQRIVTAQAIREVRERFLIKTDYVVNIPESDKKEKLLKYRQWLRDLPQLVLNGYYTPTPYIILEYNEETNYPTL
jgi:hypothetical protein